MRRPREVGYKITDRKSGHAYVVLVESEEDIAFERYVTLMTETFIPWRWSGDVPSADEVRAIMEGQKAFRENLFAQRDGFSIEVADPQEVKRARRRSKT